VDNNYLDLGMSKSGFVHTLPSGRLTLRYILYVSVDLKRDLKKKRLEVNLKLMTLASRIKKMIS
jgi:hypothetical protein